MTAQTLTEKQHSWNRAARKVGGLCLTKSHEFRSIYNRILTALEKDNLGTSRWAAPEYRNNRAPRKRGTFGYDLVKHPRRKSVEAAKSRARQLAKVAALNAVTPELMFWLVSAHSLRTIERKKRRSEQHRQWCKANPEHRRAIERATKHTRRARKCNSGGSFTGAEWLELKAHYGHRCLACGKPESELAKLGRILAADHVQAIARGGTSYISNIQPLCHGTGGCNNLKGDKHVDYRPCNT